MPSLFGREQELERAERAFVRARAGSGSFLLLSGEAGIGKSTLAREVAARAQATGVTALWGRCWEAGGAMPYWPWVQIFRALGKNPFEDVAREQSADPQQERFSLLDRATRQLLSHVEGRPLAILLDDLHAADLPSLFLLLFLARQISAVPLVVIGTTRVVEARLQPEVAEVLAKIAREGELIELQRLTSSAVAAWIAEGGGSPAHADAVFQLTEGNPLFVDEVLRVGALGKLPRVSDGIQTVIDEHLRKLSVEARDLLGVASVLGREFAVADLVALSSSSENSARSLLRHASGLAVTEALDTASFQFTHVLLRDRLHESLDADERAELHWKAGVLGRAQGADAAVVAHHLLEGASAGDAAEAAASALRSSEQALSRLAFEAAVSVAARGLALLGDARSPLACRLEITHGEALIRAGAIERGRARCVRGAELARQLGSAEEQARAALVYASEMTGGPVVDPVMVRLLQEALSAVGTEDSPVRAKLGARLAAGLIPPPNAAEVEPIRVLARESLAMARRLGDPGALLYVGEFTRRGPGFLLPSDERFALTCETSALARQLDQPLTLIKVGPSHAVSLLEHGRRGEADAALASMVRLFADLDYPQSRWRLPMLRAGFAFFDDRLDEAEREGDAALALATQTGSHLAESDWATQRIALAIAREDPASIAPHVGRILGVLARAPAASVWVLSQRAWVLAATGRRDEALDALRAATAMEQGYPTLMYVAAACALLEDAESARAIYDQLEQRFSGTQFFWGAASGFAFGPTSLSFGDLARIQGRRTTARRHYEDAIQLCREVGARSFLRLAVGALERLNRESTGDVDPGGSEEQDGPFDSFLREAAHIDGQGMNPLPRRGQIVGGKYRIEERIGRGGMGAVFRATHVVSHKSVAVKWMLRPADPQAQRRFLREARAAARVDHANVVDVYDVGQDGDCGYLVMELLRGEALRARLTRGPLGVAETVALLLPAMRGVSAVHQAGVIHRDLKPDNIFLCESPDGTPREAKVLDFGISAMVACEPDDATLTKDGVMLGTPAYMSPEQLEGKTELDVRADVYSLGVVLYEALSGRLPFDAESYPGLILAIAQAEPRQLTEVRPELPAELQEVVLRALGKRREDRYSSVEDLVQALLPFAGTRSPEATKVTLR